jgi:hypothetical protein
MKTREEHSIETTESQGSYNLKSKKVFDNSKVNDDSEERLMKNKSGQEVTSENFTIQIKKCKKPFKKIDKFNLDLNLINSPQ